MLPILHLNGYKIAGPTVLGRASDDDIRSLLEGHGYEVHFVEGDEPTRGAPGARDDARRVLRRASARSSSDARAARRARRAALAGDRAAHAEGLDRARRSSTACRSRARSARTRCRCATCATNPEQLAMLETWLRSYRPEELFDDDGRLRRRARARSRRAATRRMGANPHANGGALLRAARRCPTSTTTRSPCRSPATEHARVDAPARRAAARHLRATNPTNFRLFCPDETNSNRLGAVFEVENRCFVGADHSRSTITSRPTAA